MIHNVCGAKILRNSEFDDVFRDCYDMDVIIWGREFNKQVQNYSMFL